MNRKALPWFMGGFVCGTVCLAVAVWALPRPRAAEATPADPTLETAVLNLVERLDALTAEVEVSPSSDARESALGFDLQAVRAQIAFYKIQHLESAPGFRGGDFDASLFVDQLLSRTDGTGATGVNPSVYPLGPYMCKLPTNPFLSGLAADRVSAGPGPPPGDGKTGWHVNTTTGRFSADDKDHTGL